VSAPYATALPAHALRRCAAGLTLAVAALAAACSGGGSPAEPSTATDAEWVRSVMADRYLYADRMPAIGLTPTTSPAQALEALRVNPPDRFSYLEQRARYEGFFGDGRALGLGIGYRVDGTQIVLRVVQPDSPAARAGLLRGDRVRAIGGVDAATLVADDGVSAAFGPAQAGLVVDLVVERDGRRFERSVTKDWYTVAPILATRVLEHGAERIGYVALYTFTEPTRAAWAAAIAALRADGVRSLVVDLRDNGGGLLLVAAGIAASLAPREAIGQPFVQLRHSARRAADDVTIPLPGADATGGFERVAWLVSEASCSAAETLIAGLRPYRADPVIGTRTCGKPVGFEPQVRGDLVLSVVTFSSRNRDGLTDWFDGLPPTCAVADDPYLPWGDAADPRVAEALQVLTTGRCSAAAGTPKSLPAARPGPAAVHGLSSETGLW
jgi:carboxyl-terminal processing protease